MKRLLPLLAVIVSALTCCPALGRPVAEQSKPVEAANRQAVSKSASPDHAKIRREINRILALPEYNCTPAEGTIERLQARAGKWLRDEIGSILSWIADHLSFGSREGRGLLAALGTWAVVAAFAAILALIALRYLRHAAGYAGHSDEEQGRYDLPSAAPLMNQAAKLAEAGDYRGAFRAAYLACIAYLDGIRAVHFERGRTNWEYLRELKRGGRDRLYTELHSITLDFDRKIYGGETCARQDYLKAAAVYERLTSEAAK